MKRLQKMASQISCGPKDINTVWVLIPDLISGKVWIPCLTILVLGCVINDLNIWITEQNYTNTWNCLNTELKIWYSDAIQKTGCIWLRASPVHGTPPYMQELAMTGQLNISLYFSNLESAWLSFFLCWYHARYIWMPVLDVDHDDPQFKFSLFPKWNKINKC